MVRDSDSPRFTSSPAKVFVLLAALFCALVGCTEPPAPAPDAKCPDVLDATKDALEDASLDAAPDRADAAPDRADAALDGADAAEDTLDAAADADASADGDARFVFADLAPFVPDDAPPPGYDVNFDRSWDALSLDVSFRLVDVSALYADAGPPDTGVPTCTPGTIEACACSDGRSGYQTCEYDFAYSPCACAEPPPVITTPRLVAPLSGMRVTSQRPTLRWLLPAGVTRARVELCADRPCTRMLAQQEVTGNSWRSPTRFDPGVLFWRVKGLDAAGAEVWTSATWLFQVRRRDTEVDSTLGLIRDYNGDGYDDLLVHGAYVRGEETGVGVYFGTPSGLTLEPLLTLPRPADRATLDSGEFLSVDLTGDGITDVAVLYYDRVTSRAVLVDVYAGERMAPLARRIARVSIPTNPSASVGNTHTADLDADGFPEFVWRSDFVYRGSQSGPEETPSYVYAMHVPMGTPNGWTTGKDFNADGLPEFFERRAGSTNVVYGRGFLAFHMAPQPLLNLASTFFYLWSNTTGDFNGDGAMDIASGGVFFFSPLGKYAPAVQQSFGGIRAIQHGATFRVLRPDLTPLPPIEPTMSDFSRTGDMNGDGFADLAVVAPLEPYLDVSVFAGGRMGLSNIPVATLGSSTGAAQQAGLCGDMNGDGYDDLAVIYRVSTENWFLAVFNGASAAAATSSWVIRMNRSSRLCD